MGVKISKRRWDYSFNLGRLTEELFKTVMESRGNTCIKASKDTDINDHIDFYVNDLGVDVKGNRQLDCIWLEIQNVHGEKGWLQGEADYIVFDIVELKSFCIFERLDLYNLVKDIKQTTRSNKEYMKLLSRNGRQDLIVKTKYSHIKHLQKQIISYEKFDKRLKNISINTFF